MSDPYGLMNPQAHNSGTRSEPITPHDTDPLSDIPTGIYVGTGGHIVMQGPNDEADRTWKNVQSGSVIPFRPQYVRATGTGS